MKRTLLLATTLLLGASVKSQITYTSDNYAAVSDSFHISVANSGFGAHDFTQSGANVNWDFSALGLNQQKDQRFLDPSSAGYKSSWCVNEGIIIGCNSQFAAYTNLGQYGLDSVTLGTLKLANVVDHYQHNASALTYQMQGATIEVGGIPIPFITVYEEADTIFRFPMNYGDSYTSKSSYKLDLNSLGVPLRYDAKRRRSYEIDGWGSLKTPYGDFASVLKVKTMVYKTDTLYTDSLTVPITDTLVSYEWLDSAYGIPVLKVEGNLILGQEVYTKASYIDGLRCIAPTPLFVYSPLVLELDSLTQQIDVKFTNLSANADVSAWNFGDGTSSQDHSPSHTYHCAGLYLVSLTVTNQLCNPDSSATLNLPLYISDSNNLLVHYQSLQACDSVMLHGNWYYDSQLVTDTLFGSAANGCDSIVVTDLQLGSVISQIMASGDSLLVSPAYDSYQWYSCADQQAVAGATSAFFLPGDLAEYYVVVTSGACSSTSSCMALEGAGLTEEEIFHFTIYPNPTKDHLMIEMDGIEAGNYELLGIEGKLIRKGKIDSPQTKLDLSTLSRGSYLLKLRSSGTEQIKRFLKE
ncbi:MAG: T9SS type A sorting domain-containing protein [Bacteroidetes bacterium]|nr:MAG: T9SS type A sorting domain-containing protein [Bacteroidota bacterium]